MKTRTVLVGIALVSTLALAGACAKKDGAATPGSSATASAGAPVDGKADLVAAFAKANSTSSAFELNTDIGSQGTLTATGKQDPAKKLMSSTATVTAQGAKITIDMRLVGTDMYLKISGIPLPNVDASKWLHLDLTTSKGLLGRLGVPDPSDPVNIRSLSESIVTAQKNGTGTYSGTMDLTKGKAGGVSAKALSAMGDAAKSVPFEATVGDDGYPTSMTVKIPAAGEVPATTLTSKLSDFGAPVAVAKPAPAEVKEFPTGAIGI